jgi:DNA adenine methylase
LRFLEQFSDLLRRTELEVGDFETVLRRQVVSGDFVYLDPPYAVGNRRVFRQYTPDSFGSHDLVRMARLLDWLDGKGVAFVLSYAYCAEALRCFAKWERRKVYCQRNVAGFAAHRRKAAELIVSNGLTPPPKK